MGEKKIFKWRTVIQGFFLFIVIMAVINHQLSELGLNTIPFFSKGSLHALCPFGGVVSIYKLFTEGTFVQKIHESSLILMTIVIFTSILFGPVFCGWFCPLGTVQEWIGKLGGKLLKRKYNKIIPKKYDNLMRNLRYIVLVMVLYMTAKTGTLLFANIDPYYALFNFWTGEVAVGAMIILGITILSSLFIERPWCKYACPLGALLGISNFFRIFSIERNEKTCVVCKRCDRVCPMNIEIANKTRIKNHQCISCMECTSEITCPIDNTLNMQSMGRKKYEDKN